MINENTEWNEKDGNYVTFYDEDGTESTFEVLTTKKHNGHLYLLVAALNPDAPPDAGEDDDYVEVLHFKGMPVPDGEDLLFEIVDEGHDEFPEMLDLFRDDYAAFGIELEEVDLDEIDLEE